MQNQNPEVKNGMFITVVEWTSHRDNSYKGDCLEVIVVDDNLLRVTRADAVKGSFDDRIFTIDLNSLIVRELSAEFVQSCMDAKAAREALA